MKLGSLSHDCVNDIQSTFVSLERLSTVQAVVALPCQASLGPQRSGPVVIDGTAPVDANVRLIGASYKFVGVINKLTFSIWNMIFHANNDHCVNADRTLFHHSLANTKNSDPKQKC